MINAASLVKSLQARSTPVITWYGPDDERVDLSGKVTANWIIKASNLLTMELSSEPGVTVNLDLPTHWRSLVWACAAWCTGAEITFTTDADIVITATPSNTSSAEQVVIALPALARKVPHLPAGAVDGASDLMTQPDDFILPAVQESSLPTGLDLSQGELLAREVSIELFTAATTPGTDDSSRVLIAGVNLEQLLRTVPSLWAHGASIVLLGESLSEPDRDAIADSEGVTHTLAM